MTSEAISGIKSLPPASTVFPLKFTNGNKITEINLSCGNCQQDVDQANIRGTMTLINEHTIAFNGFALCYDCKTISPVNCRFSNDGTFLYKTGNGWTKDKITQDDPGLIIIAWRYLYSRFACHFSRAFTHLVFKPIHPGTAC